MTALALGVGALFGLIGAGAERLASVWPPDEASKRSPGWRTALMALASAAAGWAIAARSTLPWWATAAHLLILSMLVVLSATDLEQRRLPHVLLDPLIVIALAFVFFNPTVEELDAVIGAVAAIGFLGVLGLIVRSGVAMGDLYLVAPLGMLLGWPAIFLAIFLAALVSSVTSIALLVSRRVGLKSYIPFGPFLVAGAVLTLIRDDELLGRFGDGAATVAGWLAMRLTSGPP